jgi:hypothetical protein
MVGASWIQIPHLFGAPAPAELFPLSAGFDLPVCWFSRQPVVSDYLFRYLNTSFAGLPVLAGFCLSAT